MPRKKRILVEPEILIECQVGDWIEVLVDNIWKPARFSFLIAGKAPHIRYLEYDSFLDEQVESPNLTMLPDDTKTRLIRRTNLKADGMKDLEDADPILRKLT